MKTRFAFQPRYFFFWLLFFEISRGLFLLYHGGAARQLSADALLGTFFYGLRLDASAAAYISALPFVLFILDGLLRPRPALLGRVVGAYSAVLGTLFSILVVADLELYHVWGFRVDDTLLQYLGSPREMVATSGSAPLGLLFSLIGGLMLGGWWLYNKVVGGLPGLPPWFGRGRAALAGLLYAALLVVPMRGGTQQIPVNQSDVYFSEVPFANHAALNAPWNLLSAALRRDEMQPVAPFMADNTALRLVSGIYPLAAADLTSPTSNPKYPTPSALPSGLRRVSLPADSTSLLSEYRPNVLFIILESFTAKLVGCVGGEQGITPSLDSLARTGVLFSNIYAAGDRSQKGLVALLSGYPNQSTTSIIKYPHKTQHLPHLCQSLAAAGYRSHYYYGGELAFANMKSYLRTAGYEKLTERNDFAAAEQTSKWGAHDGVLFDRMLTDLRQQPSPFFVTAFTLSSHEPFEVPMKPKFPGKDEAGLFRNSVVYTDYALGQFLKKARQQPWYAHTLLVLCADHGHAQPGNTSQDNPAKFHIPLVLAGGALRPEARGRVVPTIGSQTDVAATLLRQLQLPAQQFVWSRDLLAPQAPSFAYYCYNNGFGTVAPAGTFWFDNVSRRPVYRDSGVPDAQVRLGEAMEQLTLEDFARR